MNRLVVLSALALTGCVVPGAFLIEEPSDFPALKLPSLPFATTWKGADRVGDIQGVCWIGSGRVALIGAGVSIRDAASGESVADLADAGAPEYAVARSPDGTAFATAGWEGRVRLWDAASGRLLATFVGADTSLYAVAFSPDGQLLAAGGHDGRVCVWEVATARCVLDEGGERNTPVSNAVNAVAFTADSGRLILGESRSRIRVLDVRLGKEVASFKAHQKMVDALACAPSGRVFASGSNDGTVAVWSATDYKEVARLKNPDAVRRLAFLDPEDLLVAVGGVPGKIVPASGFVQVTRWTTGRVVSRRHLWDDYAEALAVGPDGKSCVAATAKGSVLLWRLGGP